MKLIARHRYVKMSTNNSAGSGLAYHTCSACGYATDNTLLSAVMTFINKPV